MKKSETQEQEFLEVCSSYDHDLLTGKREMTLKDYERITYLVSSLGYSQYLQFLIGKYMDLSQADEEREEREHEIYLEYPEYYITLCEWSQYKKAGKERKLWKLITKQSDSGLKLQELKRA